MGCCPEQPTYLVNLKQPQVKLIYSDGILSYESTGQNQCHAGQLDLQADVQGDVNLHSSVLTGRIQEFDDEDTKHIDRTKHTPLWVE